MIPAVKKQFQIVSGLLNRPDVDVIYICTDSGREGEYIYRLVARWRMCRKDPQAGLDRFSDGGGDPAGDP